ncbi:hypothetical protein Poli38472_001253 [Pythium oligandrum]|uniref:SCP domain-containing protein n=1 Tax=Pythium oligandrum TaxID=41045 RepID=A0A8K1CSJ6_PYTOL|nr:hypothetical protein Poli38472_001253 [Pythium oligandrum]|eukprot:TMW69097.1 hypothetical protein Poli38472_001253 [Pythium oligandrum]
MQLSSLLSMVVIALTASSTVQAANPPKNSVGGLSGVNCLNAHNKARKEVGVPLLKWDENLAKKGKNWATHMEKNKFFGHNTPGKNDAQMNNLYSGTSCVDAVAAFYKEKNKLPKDRIVRAHNYQQYGHYTMMVWRKTTRVGCGRGPNKNVACYYEVPGNMIGQAAY